MFFHPIVKHDSKESKSAKINQADVERKFKEVGLKPIECVIPIKSFMLNSFGHIMNDIQAFMRTNDPALQSAILTNLQDVRQTDANKDMTIQDVFDTIVPNNVQTPAEIQRFCRVASSKFEGVISRHSKVFDLKEVVVPGTTEEKPVTIQANEE